MAPGDWKIAVMYIPIHKKGGEMECTYSIAAWWAFLGNLAFEWESEDADRKVVMDRMEVYIV